MKKDTEKKVNTKKETLKKEEVKKAPIKKNDATINTKAGFYIIAIGAILPIIILIGTMTTLKIFEPNKDSNTNVKENDKKNDNNKTNDNIKPDEETIKNEFGVSKEAAIKIIENIYHSDNYEFDAEVTMDSKYKVTAKNIDNNTKITYIVDPATKQYSIQ